MAMVSIEEATTCREITTKVREEATNPNSNDLENHLVLGTNPLNKVFGANHNKDSGIDRNKVIGISHSKVFWNQPQQGPWSQPNGPPRSQQNTGQPYRNNVSQGSSQQNAEQRQVQIPTPQVNQPSNQSTSQRPTNPTYAEISTAQQGGETAQTQTENQTQKN